MGQPTQTSSVEVANGQQQKAATKDGFDSSKDDVKTSLDGDNITNIAAQDREQGGNTLTTVAAQDSGEGEALIVFEEGVEADAKASGDAEKEKAKMENANTQGGERMERLMPYMDISDKERAKMDANASSTSPDKEGGHPNRYQDNHSQSPDLEAGQGQDQAATDGIMPLPTSLQRNAGGPAVVSQPGAYANTGFRPTGAGTPTATPPGAAFAQEALLPPPPPPPVVDNSGLAVADPVDSGHFIDTAEPVLEDQDMKRRKGTNSSSNLLFGVTGVVILALILGIGLGLGLRNNNNNNNSSNNNGDVGAATNETETEDITMLEPQEPVFDCCIVDLPNYTIEILENDFVTGREQVSPQSQAYDWLLNDPNLHSFPDWRKIQRFALATFYYSLGGNDWDLQERWLDYNTTNECDWYFKELVSSVQSVGPWGDQIDGFADLIEYLDSPCDAKGRYLSLIFTSNKLEGTIPREIELLAPSLQFLEVGNNALVGSIPTQIGRLSQLRRFYSDWSNLHTGQIPTQMGLLTKLEELDIGYNKFTGAIPTELGLLSDALRFLSIKRTTVTGFLPTELYLLTNLEVFFLHGNKGLTGAALLPDIGNMTRMQRFVAHDAPMFGTIPSEIGVLSNCWEFFLYKCELTGTLPTELWQLTKMLIVDLGQNHLSGTLATDLGLLSNLTHWNIKNNDFTGQLPYESIGYLGQLTNLQFARNEFSGSLPTEVGKMTSLDFFDLEYNIFSGSVPTEFGELSNTLKSLFLNGNIGLSGTLPSELLQLSILETLTLSNTSLTGSIPSELCPAAQEAKETCELYYDGKLEWCGYHVFTNMSCSDVQLCGCDCTECPTSL